ncbi:MAG: hypothetical protein IPN17_28665 [Deltaproteobacteria bacterium]|nr:hypothetical protein [Deltaproteobacteria bacterium]
MSQVNMNKTSYKMGASNVKFEGSDAITVLKPTGQNRMSANAPAGAQIAPSQTTVIIVG